MNALLLSLSTVSQKLYGFPKFCALKINLAINFIQKTAGMHWLGYNDAVSWLNEVKNRIFQPAPNFENFKIYLHFICQPAIRPGCTRCRAPEISRDKGNGRGFTKMLFRRRFTHCTMAIPFIRLSPSLFFFILLTKCESHLRR